MWEADDSQDLWATPGNSPAASMAHGERMVGSELTAEDLDVDRTLRPQRLDDYCGQEHIKQSLRVLIEAAQSRGETLDHVIFSGPPGLGKTTLATVIANELGAQIKTTSGPAIARTGDLAAILTNLQPGDVLFIDEIHRHFDFCLIDAAAGIGEAFALATCCADRAVVVTTNDPSSLRDAQRTVMELHRFPSGYLHLVVNRVRRKLLQSLHTTIDDAIDAAGLPLLGVIPEDENVPAVLGRGLSQRLKYHSGALCACENIARRLCGERVRLMRL